MSTSTVTIGVTDVLVELAPEATSTVAITSSASVADDAVRADVEEAGYKVTGP